MVAHGKYLGGGGGGRADEAADKTQQQLRSDTREWDGRAGYALVDSLHKNNKENDDETRAIKRWANEWLMKHTCVHVLKYQRGDGVVDWRSSSLFTYDAVFHSIAECFLWFITFSSASPSCRWNILISSSTAVTSGSSLPCSKSSSSCVLSGG